MAGALPVEAAGAVGVGVLGVGVVVLPEEVVGVLLGCSCGVMALRSKRALCACPEDSARCSGVALFTSCTEGLAPASNRSLITSVWPAEAASCSGVSWYLLAAFGFALAANSMATIDLWPSLILTIL